MRGKVGMRAALIAGVIVAILLLLRFQQDPSREVVRDAVEITATPPASETRAPRSRPSPGTIAVLPPDPETLQDISSHPLAVSFGSNLQLASREPSILLEILQFYRQEFGSFPPGEDNAQILNALRGNNPSGLPVMPSDHPRLDPDGNLLDAWGHPFVFHSLGSQHLEVRSLGPDGVIFTDDDITVPKRP